MELELYGADDKFYSKLDQEDALLGSYPVDDGCRIHVRPPYLPSIHLFNKCLPYFALCDNQDRPSWSPNSAWSKTDPSLDNDIQSGLCAGESPGDWRHQEELPDSIWEYQRGFLKEGMPELRSEG